MIAWPLTDCTTGPSPSPSRLSAASATTSHSTAAGTSLRTSGQSSGRRRSEAPHRKLRSSLTSLESTPHVKSAKECESRRPGPDVIIVGMAVGEGQGPPPPGEDTGSPEMAHTAAPAATVTTRDQQGSRLTAEMMTHGRGQTQTAHTSQRHASWEALSSDRPSGQFTQHRSARAIANPLISPLPIPEGQATNSATETMPPTSTSTGQTMTNCTLASRVQVPETENGSEEDQHSSQQTPQPHDNLLKRRASVSPEKFNHGHLEPLSVRTDLPLPESPRPAKRFRAESPFAVENGVDGISGKFDSGDRDRTDAVSEPRLPAITTFTSPCGNNILSRAVLSGRLQPVDANGTNTPATTAEEKPFNLLKAFIDDQALCLLLVSYLTIPSLIDLYSISKAFHHTFNKNATAFILSNMRTWAPHADQIFPWRCYQPLCIKDPEKKQKSKPAALGADVQKLGELSRDVPSLRWLQMVVWREGVTKDMIIQLATKALLVPAGTRVAIKRMWFLLDLPLNAHRLALIRSPTYITNKTLYLATHFFLKVDMAFTDPGRAPYPANHPNQTQFPQRWAHGAAVGCTLREKLTAERSFTSLWRVLRGWSWDPADAIGKPMSQGDVLKLWARQTFIMPENAPAHVQSMTAFGGMKVGRIPLVGYERVYDPATDESLSEEERARMPKNTYKPRPLMRPDQLIVGECVRRELKQHLWWPEMMLWGFIAPNGRTIRARTEEEILAAAKGRRRVAPKATQQTADADADADEEKGAGKGKAKSEREVKDGQETTDGQPKTPATAVMFGGT